MMQGLLPEAVLAEVCDRTGDSVPQSGATQGSHEVGKAMASTARAVG